MNVSEAARRSGLSAKTLRHYDDIGLVRPVRSPSGYRSYSQADIDRLQFVRRARATGFSLDAARRLLLLHDDVNRQSRDVKRLVERQICEIDARMRVLGLARDALGRLADRCPGDDAGACPILDELATGLFGEIDLGWDDLTVVAPIESD